ncbi:MAG: SPOR domain-containing protein [Gammaproteobacteria bacterium]
MNVARTCLLLLVCATFAALPARADDLELGMRALENGHVRRAIELWTPLAEQGNAEAQFGLGVIHNDAVGVPQDYAEANYWFLRAAEQGYAPAQFNLGNAYKNGTGFNEDAGMAVIWWRKAAEQDFAPAQFNLGTALIEGVGVPRDAAAGREWYRRAAANGHPYAQRYLDANAAGTAPAGEAAPSRRAATVPSEPPPSTPATTAVASQAPAARGTAAAAAALPNAADAVAASPRATDGSSAECSAWLADVGTDTHTVQLMASREIASAQAYVARHALDGTAICSYRVKGRQWHALVRGQYGSAAEARAALAALPAAVRADGAYVRHIREIRAALKDAGG